MLLNELRVICLITIETHAKQSFSGSVVCSLFMKFGYINVVAEISKGRF